VSFSREVGDEEACDTPEAAGCWRSRFTGGAGLEAGVKSLPLQPGTPPAVVGEWMVENGWSLADVLEWFAGELCASDHW
jgi:hypothetical protein